MNIEDSPLVTAVITTQNRAQMLLRAVHSVLQQTYKNLEIVIVDDCSSDETEGVVAQLRRKHPAIKYIRNSRVMGACLSRNAGITAAKGQFVSGLDDDDEWLPHRIETFIEAYDPVFSMVGSYDRQPQMKEHPAKEKKTIIGLDDLFYENIFGNQAFVERERILALGGFDPELPSAQDYDMWLRIVENFGPAKMIPEALQIIHVAHEKNRITKSHRAFKGYFRCYRKHKALMSESHRKYQMFNLYREREKRLSMRVASTLWEPRTFGTLLWYWFLTSPFKKRLLKLYRRIATNPA